MKTGLTLGKFAPFHRGHEYMIQMALKEVDRLFVLIYNSSDTNIPLTVRSSWIHKLYPQVDVLEGWGGPEECGRERVVELKQEEYVLKLLNRTFFAFSKKKSNISMLSNLSKFDLDTKKYGVLSKKLNNFYDLI